MATRQAFKGASRRGTVSHLLKVLISLQAMDDRETAQAATDGRDPVLFMSDDGIRFAVDALVQNAQACLAQIKG